MTVQSEFDRTDAIPVAEAEKPSDLGRTKRVLIIAAVALVTIVIIGFAAFALATNSWVKSGRIAPNVSIAGMPAAGMTVDEARMALENDWVRTLPEVIVVTFPPDGKWEATREELGATLRLEVAAQQAVRVAREGGLLDQMRARMALRNQAVDVEVPVEIDEVTLEEAIGGLAEIVYRKPVDATVEVSGDNVSVVPGVEGRSLDAEGTKEAIAAALADPAAGEVEAIVEVEQPSITAEELSHIQVVLARYSTPYKSHQTDRTHNLKLAAAKLHKLVLRPGEIFSFNERVGERLASEGYRDAPIFINGEVEPSVGGGVCQIATTTYNVALLANLDMVERHHHSRPVDYAPTGRDATVYWGQYDLKFRNSLKHPILILTSVGSSEVTFRILGSREDEAEVDLIREGLSRVTRKEKEVPDPELEEGKREVEEQGRDGWRVTVYRKATRDGATIRDEKLHTDYYAPQTKVIRVGTKPPEEKPEAEPQPAVTPPAASPANRPADSSGTAPSGQDAAGE